MPRPAQPIVDGKLRCAACLVFKDFSEFTKDKHVSTGYISSCKECRSKFQGDYRINVMYKMRYGITRDEYNVIFDLQNGMCAICGLELDKDALGQERLMVDHDHDTDAIRGLLCRNCNIGLGHFSDDVVKLANAIAYLERSRLTQKESGVKYHGFSDR